MPKGFLKGFLSWTWIVVFWGLLGSSQAQSFEPSPAYRLLSPYRAGSTGSLPYVAKHFDRIYNTTAAKLGGLQPIRPRLGIPAFVSTNGYLHVEYLGRVAAFSALQQGISFWLIPIQQKDCRVAKCYALGSPNQLRLVIQHADVALGVVVVKIPSTVPPGFYDLIHRIPRTSSRSGLTLQSLSALSSKVSAWPVSFFDILGASVVSSVSQGSHGKQKQGASSLSATTKPTTQGVPAAKEFVIPIASFPATLAAHQVVSKRVARAVQVLSQDPDRVESFSFIHLTDFHLRQHEQGRLHQVLDYLNALRPRPHFILLTGDIVEYGNRPELWQQCIQALLRLQIPVFAMIGNHDYYRVHWGQPAPIPGLLREEEGLHLFVRAFHPFLAYRFRFGGYHWLSVDTGSSATNRTWFELKWVTLQGLGAKQLEDIQSFLSTPAKYGHVLFAHGSSRAHVRHDTDGCDMGRHGVFLMHREAFEKALLASYEKRPRPLVLLHGHTHWNALYGRVVYGESCRFLRITERYPMMGTLPCWTELPMWRSPLLISTQAATKHQPLRSGGLLQTGMQFGQGAGAAYGFRLIRVQQKRWKQSIYRFYHRTRLLARKHADGYIDPQARFSAQLPTCPP